MAAQEGRGSLECICGRKFTTTQQAGAHKRKCKVWQEWIDVVANSPEFKEELKHFTLEQLGVKYGVASKTLKRHIKMDNVDTEHKCVCGKSFKSVGSLGSHKKNCDKWHEHVRRLAADPETLQSVKSMSVGEAAAHLGVSEDTIRQVFLSNSRELRPGKKKIAPKETAMTLDQAADAVKKIVHDNEALFSELEELKTVHFGLARRYSETREELRIVRAELDRKKDDVFKVKSYYQQKDAHGD